MDAPRLTTPHEILHAALENEERAHRFYESLLIDCQTDNVRKLVETLRDEEYRHMALIQDMITKLNLGRDMI